MTTLPSRLKALAEYCERAGTHELVELGHVRENARLKPLIAALIECVEALEYYAGSSYEHQDVAEEALTKLQALVEGK